MEIVCLTENAEKFSLNNDKCLPQWCPPDGECMPDKVCAPDDWCPPQGVCQPECKPSRCDF